MLVVLTYPTDEVPSDPAQLKADVAATFANVTTYYDQVSYGQLSVQVDVTDAVPLLDDTAYYWRANSAVGYPNVDEDVLPQLTAEAVCPSISGSTPFSPYRRMNRAWASACTQCPLPELHCSRVPGTAGVTVRFTH